MQLPILAFNNRIEDNEIITLINTQKLLTACKKIGDKRTPASEGIPNKALKAAIIKKPDGFLKAFQKCLDARIFPENENHNN